MSDDLTIRHDMKKQFPYGVAMSSLSVIALELFCLETELRESPVWEFNPSESCSSGGNRIRWFLSERFRHYCKGAMCSTTRDEYSTAIGPFEFLTLRAKLIGSDVIAEYITDVY